MSKNHYDQEAWLLTDLFTGIDDPEIQQALESAEEQIQAFEGWRSKLDSDLEPATFLEIVQAYERLVRAMYRLLGFASLSYSSDTQDQAVQALQARFRQVTADADNRTLFFKLWWKEIDDNAAGRFLEVAGDYHYWLEALRLERPYTLSEPEERVINLKDVNGSQALMTLYSTITNRYAFSLEVDGEVQDLTREELGVYYRHTDPELRAAAYKELYRVYGEDVPVLGQIYQAIARDWRSENVDLRGYASPIAVRNLYNDIPDDVVNLLLDVSQANAPIFQRYFQLKARWLGVEKMRRYDLYAPVVAADTRYNFSEAVDLVLTSYERFDPHIAKLAERVFAEHHLDSEVRKGKRGGAFCSTISPDLTPWVLQSYNGRPDDVATLAHELGHAVHSMLAEHHTALTQHASLPLAETASTFGEMLVIDRLLAEDPDPEMLRDLLFRQMDHNYATIMRQSYFALFERDAHKQIKEGATIDELSALYALNLASQFADSIEISDDFNIEWMAIPHIYSVPFYVYAYAFGQLLVLSLYQQYLADEGDFKNRYLALLSAGGSDAPARILERAGIDIHSAEFWQGGFDVLRTSLAKLEALAIPK
ncbi:MAG: M3 family oligoendopeptidase [Candidatus Promineifilaceae bacterium]